MNEVARRGALWLLVSLPCLLALVISRIFSPPFAAPKDAIFEWTSFTLAALALIFSFAWKPVKEDWSFYIAATAYLFLTTASALNSHESSMCLRNVIFLGCGILLFLVARALLAGKRDAVQRFQISLSIAASLVSLLTVMQFFRIDSYVRIFALANATGRMRIFATLGNPDFVATFLAMALPSALGLAIASRSWRAFWIAVSSLIAVASLLSGSRCGMLALAAGALVIVLTQLRRHATSIVLVLITVLVLCTLSAGSWMNSRSIRESLQGRVLIWQVSLADGAAQSALGSGPGSFAHEYPVRLGRYFSNSGREPMLRFASLERHAEDDYVEAWHDTGWLGLVALLALLGLWFRIAVRRLRQSEDEARTAIAVAIASVTALCVASLFDFPMHRAETWALLWIFMAVPMRMADLTLAHPRLSFTRCAGGLVILVLGSGLALAPLVVSYKLAEGESDEEQNRLGAAQEDYRAVLRWDRSSSDANFELVRVMAKLGDYNGALEQSRIAARYVNEPELYLLRARILENAGLDVAARNELEAAVRLFPYAKVLQRELKSILP